MATTHIDYRKIDYDQLLDKPITRVESGVNPNTLTTAGVYDRGDGNRFIVTVDGQNITQVIEKKDGYETRSSTDGGTTWGAWETVVFSKSGDIDAEDVNYDNTTSELTATDVQAAIDEIDTSVDDVKEDITDIQTDITNIEGDITNIQGDITEIKNIVEVTTMDTPSEDNEGSIVQYKGATNANFTHGYFYECVGDGQDPESFARVRIDVQPAGAGDDHEFITQAAYNALTPAEKAAKVYMIKEEGVPGSLLTAGAGIDITNNVISADMSTAVYDNTISGATATNVQDAIDEVFQSVSNGKTLIAAAITDKGVSTAASDSFATMASNIGNIITGGKYSENSLGDVIFNTTTPRNSTSRSAFGKTDNYVVEGGDNVWYFCFVIDKYNSTWAVCGRYNETTKKLETITLSSGAYDPNGSIKICKDSNKVYFGMTGTGYCYYDLELNTFTTYNTYVSDGEIQSTTTKTAASSGDYSTWGSASLGNRSIVYPILYAGNYNYRVMLVFA